MSDDMALTGAGSQGGVIVDAAGRLYGVASGAGTGYVKILVGANFLEDHGWISKSPDARA